MTEFEQVLQQVLREIPKYEIPLSQLGKIKLARRITDNFMKDSSQVIAPKLIIYKQEDNKPLETVKCKALSTERCDNIRFEEVEFCIISNWETNEAKLYFETAKCQ